MELLPLINKERGLSNNKVDEAPLLMHNVTREVLSDSHVPVQDENVSQGRSLAFFHQKPAAKERALDTGSVC